MEGDAFQIAMGSYEIAKADAQTRLREFGLDQLGRELEFTFKVLAPDFDTYAKANRWHEWVKEQAWLFWQYRGAPTSQGKEGEVDDYMQAQRYLGYLLAEYLLGRLQDPNVCPLDLLKSEHIKYLVGLSVEEFVRFRAYFVYRLRLRVGAREKADTSQDYDFAADTVRASLRGLLRRCRRDKCDTCRQNIVALHHNAHGRPIDLVRVAQAKRNVLTRLRVCNEWTPLVDKCVKSLYPWLEQREDDSEDQRGTSPEESGECLCTHFAVGNLFEFLAMCVVAREATGSLLDRLPNLGMGTSLTPSLPA